MTLMRSALNFKHYLSCDVANRKSPQNLATSQLIPVESLVMIRISQLTLVEAVNSVFHASQVTIDLD